MIAALGAIAFCAVLFIAFGVLRPKGGCSSGSCGACDGECPLHSHSRDSSQ